MKAIALVCAIAALTAWVLTGLVRRHSLRIALLDIPNSRSSHTVPTARGGGVAIVITSLAGMIGLATLGFVETRLLCALVGGGLAIAFVGYLDDRGRIGIGGRMGIHFVAAAWAVAWTGGLVEIHFGTTAFQLGMWGPVLSILGIVWVLNLFNFMDGIDGIAAAEAIFVAVMGGFLAGVGGAGLSVQSAAYMLAAASLGFLSWNWPPARIFMGDVGSAYLGYCLAVLALTSAREKPATLNVWLIVAGVFLVDATLTLIRRLLRREQVYQAHRSHAYQWQARKWGSHRTVTLATILLNVLWLAPWAWLAAARPDLRAWALAGAVLPLGLLGAVLGSGKRE